jgi:hypothetical protein
MSALRMVGLFVFPACGKQTPHCPKEQYFHNSRLRYAYLLYRKIIVQKVALAFQPVFFLFHLFPALL